MNVRQLPVTALIITLTSAVLAGQADIAYEGLHSTYETLADIRVIIRNVADAPVYIDSPGGDTVLIERWSRDRGVWEQGKSFPCAYDGPTEVAPGGEIHPKLTDLWAFEPFEDVSWFETEKGARRPLRGRYRLRVRYSTKSWQTRLGMPDSIEIVDVLSPEFETADGR